MAKDIMKEFFNLIQEKTRDRELLEEHRKALDLVIKKNDSLEHRLYIYGEIMKNVLGRIDELKYAPDDLIDKNKALEYLRVDIKESLKEFDNNADIQV